MLFIIKTRLKSPSEGEFIKYINTFKAHPYNRILSISKMNKLIGIDMEKQDINDNGKKDTEEFIFVCLHIMVAIKSNV